MQGITDSDKKTVLRTKVLCAVFLCNPMTNVCPQNLWRHLGKEHKGKPTPK